MMRSRVFIGMVLAACLAGCLLPAIAQQPGRSAAGPQPRSTPFQRLRHILRGNASPLNPRHSQLNRQQANAHQRSGESRGVATTRRPTTITPPRQPHAPSPPRAVRNQTVIPVASTLEEGEQPLLRLAVPNFPRETDFQRTNAIAQANRPVDSGNAESNQATDAQPLANGTPSAGALASSQPRGILAPFFARNNLARNNLARNNLARNNHAHNNRAPSRQPLFFNRVNQPNNATPAQGIAQTPPAAGPAERIARTAVPMAPMPSIRHDANSSLLMLAERTVAPPAIAPPRPNRVMIFTPSLPPEPEPALPAASAVAAQPEADLPDSPIAETATPPSATPLIAAPEVTAPQIPKLALRTPAPAPAIPAPAIPAPATPAPATPAPATPALPTPPLPAPLIATTEGATLGTAAPEVIPPEPTLPAPIPNERVLTIDRSNPPSPTIAVRQPSEIAPPVLRPVTLQPPAIPKLSVYMAGPAKVQHGEFALVKVRVVNTGTGAARDVILDIVGNEQLLKTMSLGGVPAGRSVEVELQLTPQVLGSLELQAVAKASAGERAVAVRAMFVGKPQLKLAIAGPGTIHHGEVQLYTAIVDNQGNTDAEKVSLLVMLQGKEAQSLAVGNVLAGQQRRITFELRPEHGGTLALNAVASCVGGVQAVANGSINVLKQDIELALEGPRELRLGESARYTLTVRNQGSVDAGLVTVNVSLGESVLDGLFEAELTAGQEKQVMFEVSPAQPGRQSLTAVARTEKGAESSTTSHLQVQHGQLELAASGPREKLLSGGNATYDVTIKNVGDAPAEDVLIAAHLPEGAEYLQGVDKIDFYEGVTWRAGELAPGEQQTYHLECLLENPGEQTIVFSAAGAGEISATREVATTVEALADVHLLVAAPEGQIELGEQAICEIELHNRGVKAAHDVQVKMLLGDALRPRTTEGLAGELNESGVLFETIDKLGPNETRKIRVTMQAEQAGNHPFRIEVSASDLRTLVTSEGAARFYAKAQPIGPTPATQLPVERLATPPQTPLR